MRLIADIGTMALLWETTLPPDTPGANTSSSSQPRHGRARRGGGPSGGLCERTPGALIWGGRTVFGDRSLNPGSVAGQITLWSLFCRVTGLAIAFRSSPFFNPEEIGAWDRSEEREVRVVQGSVLLITANSGKNSAI